MMMRVCVDMDMSGQSGQKGSLTQRLTALARLGHRDLPTSVSPHVRPNIEVAQRPQPIMSLHHSHSTLYLHYTESSVSSIV